MPIHSPFASVSATREVLETYGLDAKKALGQHFLINDGIVGRIMDTAGLTYQDIVLEIGPGIGTLTAALLAHACGVISVERDRDLIGVLAETCKDHADTFALVHKDALELTKEDIAHALAGLPTVSKACGNGGLPNKLIANLPYAVAATLVLDCFQKFVSLDSMTVMIQSEVADRMCARPGTKEYGAYTVKLSLYAKPGIRFTVNPQNFYPPPRVDSAVLRLDREPLKDETGSTVSNEVIDATCTMADAAFATRRKTIMNSCKTYFGNLGEEGDRVVPLLPQIFNAADIDPRLRGEALTSQEFLRLGIAYKDCHDN